MNPFAWFAAVVFFVVFFGGLALIINVVAWDGPGAFLRIVAAVMTPVLMTLAIGTPLAIDKRLDQKRQCSGEGGVWVHSQCLEPNRR